MQAHSREAERLLLDDFRIVAFLNGDVDAARRKVVEEKLLAQPGTEAVVFVSPEEGLSRIEAANPEISRSVAVLGENPLPGGFEIRLSPDRIAAVPEWARAAENIAELDDIRYKPLQARTILQVQFYARFLTLILSSAAFLWILAGVWAVGAAWRAGAFRLASSPAGTGRTRDGGGPLSWRQIVVLPAASGLGVAAGVGLALLLARPASAGWVRAWPALWAQATLLAAGASGGLLVGLLPGRERQGQGGVAGRSRPASGLSRGRVRERVAAVLAAGLLVWGTGVQAASVRTKRKELEKLSDELVERKKEADLYHKRRSEVERDLSRIESERRRSDLRIRELRGRRRQADDQHVRLAGTLSAVTSARGKGLRVLSEEVGDFSRRSAAEPGFFGSDALWEEAFRRAAIREKTRYLAQLHRFETRTASRHAVALERGRVIRGRTLKEVEAFRRHERSYKSARSAYEDAGKRLLETEERVRELEKSSKALADLIRRLEHKARRTAEARPRQPTMAKHSLPWPVAGRVVSGFGKRRVPELQTWTVHNGIEIKADAGSSVRPVKPGEVIFAGPYRSYGNVVIVNHGQGFFSIYGHLDKILKEKGDRVRTGTLIATLDGGEGRLYLELRQAGRPLNPENWLEKR
ncbi:MAG: permease-like cell division protein FtsX [Elusimicrobiota bacterium]